MGSVFVMIVNTSSPPAIKLAEARSSIQLGRYPSGVAPIMPSSDTFNVSNSGGGILVYSISTGSRKTLEVCPAQTNRTVAP